MTKKQIVKILVDVLMCIALLFLMTYNLIGDAFHEWAGAAMFLLFLLHHFLNRRWIAGAIRGKYTVYRTLQTILAALILITMLTSLFSGVVLSKYVFSFLGIETGRALSRTLHLVCAYWNLVLMPLHLGLHWNMILGMCRRFRKSSQISPVWIWSFRGIGAIIAIYGFMAFLKRGIWDYLILENQFVFFDYSEPILLFLGDYLAIMGLFIFAGHYLAVLARKLGKARKKP